MIDFSKGKKKFIPIKLYDGKLLNVYTPTIKLLGDLTHIDMNDPNVEVVCDILAKILSNNMQKIRVTKDQIAELTFDEIQILINGIVEFTTEVANQKN